ncbi:hypothetical protein Psi02_74250 [Planotetraspora silvatica]|uniref:Uncharacterized protein n=1 Tax=Planotetraspora silvatica TaxID=234614 RepID=A0A8J3UX01_9ACTN|nr:hypothetical protein [Planotetraspora silvatica]GII51001.1 hypothetical protein Psi02_74250 [Planotetraspora silvatica]
MAEGDANPAGRDRSGELFVRSYDAPTTPMPRVGPDGLGQSARPGGSARRLGPTQDRIVAGGRVAGTGGNPEGSGGRGTGLGGGPDGRGSTPGPGNASRGGRHSGGGARKEPVGRYVAIAVVATIVAAGILGLLYFPKESTGVDQLYQAKVQVGPSDVADPSVTPKPPASAVPTLPASSVELATFAGRATTVTSSVADQKSGIGYAKLGLPWQAAAPAPFSFVQRSGLEGPAQAMIASSPLPGAVPKRLDDLSDYRYYAEKAAKWTLRRQPEGSRLVWTASQPAAHGTGWLLGYKITYLVDGEKHASRAIVVVVGAAGRQKPAMVFATVPDTDKALLPDLNTLAQSIRPI